MPPDTEVASQGHHNPGNATATPDLTKPQHRLDDSGAGGNNNVVTPLDRAAALRLDKRIRLMGTTMRDNLLKIEALLIDAKAGQIHLTLGFESWTGYVADALGGQLDMNTESRRAVVEMLAGEGMSQRAIAKAVGVSQKTVDRDLDRVSHHGSPDGADQVGREVTENEPAVVTGLDGKQHPAKHKSIKATRLTPLQRQRRGIIGDLAEPARVAKSIDISKLDDGITAEEARQFHENLVLLANSILVLDGLLLKRAGDYKGGDEVAEQLNAHLGLS
jgi:transposase-like protein